MTVRHEIDPKKLQTMIRSILPSTARKLAREMKRRNCRKVRRATRQALHCVGPGGETDAWLRREPKQREVVLERRGYDKLNHFMRWCNAHTRGMSDKEAIDYVRGIVPRNLIGKHALDHWRIYVEFGGRSGRGNGWRAADRRARQEYVDTICGRIRRLLVLRPEFHGELNRVIKFVLGVPDPVFWSRVLRVWTADRRFGVWGADCPTARLLAGRHDVEPFVRAVFVGDTYSRERSSLVWLLDTAEAIAARGEELDLAAAVRRAWSAARRSEPSRGA
jgi:hypothetical protein